MYLSFFAELHWSKSVYYHDTTLLHMLDYVTSLKCAFMELECHLFSICIQVLMSGHCVVFSTAFYVFSGSVIWSIV